MVLIFEFICTTLWEYCELSLGMQGPITTESSYELRKERCATCTKRKVVIIYINACIQSRLTVVSRKAKKKQHARASSGLRDHYSELFTWMAALKF